MDRHYYVRQLRDWKFSFPLEQMLPTGVGMIHIPVQLAAANFAGARARAVVPLLVHRMAQRRLQLQTGRQTNLLSQGHSAATAAPTPPLQMSA